MEKTNMFKNNNKNLIYSSIVKYPGMNLIEISKKLSMPRTTLDYHLHSLNKSGHITAYKQGNYTRFYASKDLSFRERRILNLLKEKTPRKIILLLLLYPEYFSQINLSKYLNIGSSTVSYHLNKLIDLDLIEQIQIPNNGKNGKKQSKPKQIYRQRFEEMFVVPVKHTKKAEKYLKKTRKKILLNIRKNYYNSSTKSIPNGYEKIYKIKNLGELWHFLLKYHKILMDEELNLVLEWSDDWQDGLTDFFIDVINEIFPGMTKTYFP